MNYPIYQVDAFASEIFKGNPAAVMPLEAWLPDDTMQALAAENNLAETAFFVRKSGTNDSDFHIRWFTPSVEVPLCGHATLASAWVIFNKLDWPSEQVHFHSESGRLGVRKTSDGWLILDFPNHAVEERETPATIKDAIEGAPDTAFYVPSDANYMIVLANEAAVKTAQPDIRKLKELGSQGLIITAPGAPGDSTDFV